MIKSISLAMILLFGSLGIAAGQSADSPSTLGQLGQIDPNKPIPQVSLGFNFYHASFCTTFSGVFAFVAREDNSGWFTTDVVTIAGLTPACQTANLVAFHVVNLNGLFDQVVIYPFK